MIFVFILLEQSPQFFNLIFENLKLYFFHHHQTFFLFTLVLLKYEWFCSTLFIKGSRFPDEKIFAYELDICKHQIIWFCYSIIKRLRLSKRSTIFFIIYTFAHQYESLLMRTACTRFSGRMMTLAFICLKFVYSYFHWWLSTQAAFTLNFSKWKDLRGPRLVIVLSLDSQF